MSAALLSAMPALPEPPAWQTQVALTYHAYLLAAAIETRADARLFDDLPWKRQIGRPDWDAVFKVRRFAIYLTVIEHDVPGARVAVIAGLTKQAVSALLRSVEDLRDQPDMDELLDRIALRALGRADRTARPLNRNRVREHFHAHPDATAEACAAVLGISSRVVRIHRRRLRIRGELP